MQLDAEIWNIFALHIWLHAEVCKNNTEDSEVRRKTEKFKHEFLKLKKQHLFFILKHSSHI